MDATGLALTLAGFGVLLIAISYQRHLTRRDISALMHGMGGAALIIGGALLLAVSINFNSYTVLSEDEPLAELSLEQTGNNEFQARLLRIPSGDLQTLNLKGDAWRIQARLVQWQGWPTWLGLNRHIRFDSINSTDNGKKNTGHYALSREPKFSVWSGQAEYLANLKLLEITEAASEPMPLKHGLRFHLFVHAGKLIARQINSPIKRSSRSSDHTTVSLETFTNEFNRQLDSDGQSTETNTNPDIPVDLLTNKELLPDTSPAEPNVVH